MGPIFVVLQVTVEWPSMCPKGEQNRIGLLLQCPPSPRKYYGARVQRTSAGMPLKVSYGYYQTIMAALVATLPVLSLARGPWYGTLFRCFGGHR